MRRSVPTANAWGDIVGYPRAVRAAPAGGGRTARTAGNNPVNVSRLG